jgi:hypothetical protein
LYVFPWTRNGGSIAAGDVWELDVGVAFPQFPTGVLLTLKLAVNREALL